LAEQYFGQWKGDASYKADLGFGQKNKGNRVIFVNKPGAVQSTISISFTLDMKPGDKDQLPLTVMNGILGGSAFGARLMQNLREDKAYTYGAYSDMQVTRNGAWISASGNFRNDVTDSAITQLLYEFSRITEGYVTPEELALTKSAMAGSFARSLESPQTIARFALNIIQNGLPADYYKNYLTRLEAVSKDDILEMAQKYFKGGYNIVVVGNEDVLEKIKQFDTDGNIEKLDAFGNKVIDMKPADITADQLIQKYLFAVTKTTTEKAMVKKLKKIKSVEKTTEFDLQGMKASMTDIYAAPNKEYMRMEASGMVFVSSYYDGTKGATTNMQTGKKELTAEELASKKKAEGLFPEMNYKASGMTYDLKGIETVNGKDYYVLHSTDGDKQQFDYFAKDTYLKTKSVTIQTEEGETIENSMDLGNYKEVNGILIPHTAIMNMGGMVLNGEVKTVVVNGKVDSSLFQ